MNLRNDILEIFQALGLLLVFITVFFGMKYPLIINTLSTHAPIDKPNDLKHYRAKLLISFVTDCLPLVVLILLSNVVVFPLTETIIRINGLQIWNYESLQLAYVIIALWILLLLIWVIILSGKMLYKIIESS